MSSKDRKPYLTAASLTQQFLDFCHDNLENRLEMIVEIEKPGGGSIYASDRNKYVGGTFYEALLNFPVIGRTVGEWLSTELQFSTLTLELSNVDGRFNEFLPGGASFGGWIGKNVVVSVGVAEASGTYRIIFDGHVTDIGGFKRGVKSITIIARDDYDRINVAFPNIAFTEAAYPKIEVKNIGKLMPIIYGDWTTDTDPAPASVPAWLVNGNDPLVHFREINFTANPSTDILSSVNHDLSNNDVVQLTTSGTLPAPFAVTTDYYVVNANADDFQLSLVMAGAPINITTAGTGSHSFVAAPTATHKNLQFRISENDLTFFDSSKVYLKRQDEYFLVPSTEITAIGAGNKTFELKQKSGITWVNAAEYLFDQSDEFFVLVKGKDLGAFDDNIVWQARNILIAYGGVAAPDFHANWVDFRDKSTPAQSNIAGIKSRIWRNEASPVMTYVLSLLEQVRLEAFIDSNLELKLNSLHFEDWPAAPSHTIRNWDIEAGSFKTTIDERNNFNRAQGFYNWLPDIAENSLKTNIHKNTASITQFGKAISKKLEFPNLYLAADVTYQLIEILRLASASLEIIETNLTWRSLLQDIGQFCKIDVKIGSTIFDNVPAMIRNIGYDPQGLKIPVKLWSMAMVPFPGYTPGYTGTVGGFAATITEET